MRVAEIQVPVSHLPGAGAVTVTQLSRLGVQTVGDILLLWPRTWEDRTRVDFLADYDSVQKLQVRVKVVGQEWFGFGRMRTLKLIIQDECGSFAELACFNRNFLENAFPVGAEAVVYGSFYYKYGKLQSSAFEIEKPESAEQKILPVYPLTHGLGQAKLRKLIQTALRQYARGIDSELPAEVMEKYGLPTKQQILFFMHSPQTVQETEQARHALIFEEFFIFQTELGKRSIQRRGKLPYFSETESEFASSKPRQPVLTQLQQQLLKRLPFALTADQRTVTAEVNEDLEGTEPMARLIQGDVGSGKTLTAFLACLNVIEKGGQAAFLAPTELLARQHAENAAKLLEPLGVRLAFLTGNVKAKGRSHLLAALADGSIDLVLGTHALFSSGVSYKNLRLAVVDEQHRFGVLQRSAIIQKGVEGSKEKKPPHFLMMSATPIPRTLALSVFGDLDISVIKTMPEGRKPVITYVASQAKAEKVYTFIGKEIAAGRQAYFVYPLIEDSESLSLKSAEQMYQYLQQGFPRHKVALIHSKIPENEQKEIMEEFKAGKIHILAATSVIEVGVDVPNATCMVIEHSERFGLSALHQLRGRVGRGGEQSYCFLMYGKNITNDGKTRLSIMKETTDGFVIAEEDLKLRGPGDIGGIEQSGYLGFNLADPMRDYTLLQKARQAAFAILEKTMQKESEPL
ncbi:ATP-dependent DNA helicase RecG [Treponema phagedenis]|uniref:ATP-dependent DNA helicase RecG n=1 Tax=Treponema phagedenis TaxID=162 RepID=UPI0011E83EC6|nr:ATP-dependent DNA helicase RecG [Treponema phagedenis]QEK07909.1 ATP-dependent DNA helicase RecG [Treponema phagedenis]